MKTIVVMSLCALSVCAQEFKIPLNIEKLAAKATENVTVTLDSSMLKLAGAFLSEKKGDEAEARKLIQGLKGIYVRSFEFAGPGAYSEADVEALRAQLKAPQWNRIVGVRSKADGENADVFVRMENNQIAGLAIIAAEPKELTIVHIDGAIRPEDLSRLGGQFGVPHVEVKPGEKK
jgi:hypothetical protein